MHESTVEEVNVPNINSSSSIKKQMKSKFQNEHPDNFSMPAEHPYFMLGSQHKEEEIHSLKK